MGTETPTPEAFAAAYGSEAIVRVGFPPGKVMKLGQALAAEALCPKDPSVRQDPEKRLGYLARILSAGGSLRPEDADLIRQPE